MLTLKALELDELTHEIIKAYSANGDKLAEAKRYEEAISEYNKA